MRGLKGAEVDKGRAGKVRLSSGPASALTPELFLRNLPGRPGLIWRAAAPLRPLKAQVGQLIQNPEFAVLMLRTHPSSKLTQARYVEHFGMLGHSHDLVIVEAGWFLRIRRPICTHDGPTFLVFEFLMSALTLESAPT